MKALRTTLFVLAMVSFATQTYRHVYVRWLEPRASVLDKYGTEAEHQAASAQSLQDLESKFAVAHQHVLDYEKQNPPQPDKEPMSAYERQDREPYKSEQTLRRAIEEWESQHKDLV